MKNRSALIPVLLLSLLISTAGQTPPTERPSSTQDEVVRISTNLVQVDAVVTDKNGKLVTDLKREDFEILEDGRPQTITSFSFISTESAIRTIGPTANEKDAPPVPPVRLRPEQVRRTIALVVDDLGISFGSAPAVKKGLKKFVDNQLQPGDLVAIIRTGGGIGALQQFTSDKRQLYAAIEKVRWNPMGRFGLSSFSPLAGKFATDDRQAVSGRNPSLNGFDDGLGAGGESVDDLREEFFSVGSLGGLNYVIRGMKELPGRKSVLLISDGLKIFSGADPLRTNRVLDSMRRLIDFANRSSVVIYTIDARGVPYVGFTAEGSGLGVSGPEAIEEMAESRMESFELQEGLNYLARETGGFPIFHSNDIGAGIKRVLADQRGYYLIGYRPSESTFDPGTGGRRFHDITLKIRRPGLKHRTRRGFYGISEEENNKARLTSSERLRAALTSPFNSGAIRLRLTSIFSNGEKAGSFVRTLLHINADDLSFTNEADGQRKAVFDVLVASFGDNGVFVDHVGQTQTVRVRDADFERLRKDGLVFILTLPVKQAGAYQLRAALLDKVTGHTGSASQFIEVPNLKKNRLALSGIILNAHAAPTQLSTVSGAKGDDGSKIISSASDIQARRTEKEIAGANPLAGPAGRKFSRGMIMRFSYIAYNARLDKQSRLPQLETQMRLFRDGQPVFEGKVQKFDTRNQPDLRRLIGSGRLLLGRDLSPGEYTLQVIVSDPLAGDKYRRVTQWIDFEIVR